MHVGIVGAGISGAYLACLLADRGIRVTLFDRKAPWEKPCGGGLTFRTWKTFPILNQFMNSGRSVKRFRMISADGTSSQVTTADPLQIVSRRSLSEYLLDQAGARGVDRVRKHVDGFVPENNRWRLYAGETSFSVDTLVGADGAKSSVRKKMTRAFSKAETTLSVGYWIEGKPEEQEAVIAFLPALSGYLWIFPRRDHLSVGIGAKANEARGRELFGRLDGFLNHYFPGLKDRQQTPYAALIPSLTSHGFASNPVRGNNWALIGDAAGWVDPLTGEGVYYAFRSAELLFQALECEDLAVYASACRQEFVPELQKASSYSKFFFDPKVTTLLVELSQKNKAIQKLLVNLMTGNQGYLTLKKEVLKILPGLGRDVLSSLLGFRSLRGG